MARNGSGTMNPISNSWYPPVVGQLAAAGDWQAIYLDLIAALTQSLSRDGQGPMTGDLQMGGNKITGQSAATGTGQALIFEQLFSQGTEQDLASASTTDIGAQLTNFLRITGTTTITSFGTNYKGPRFLRFEGAVTLTNGSALTLPGGANITTAAGDCCIVIPRATLGTSDGWQVVAYQRANSAPYANSMGFKNRLINGQLLINQRGVSGTVVLTAGSYGHDRFKAGASGCTYTFATSNNVTTLTITAGSLQQVIEGLNLESGTYVLSWSGTAQGRIAGGSYGASGAVNATVVGGTNTTVEFNAGTLSLPQLEKGSTATSFDYRPYSTELALCQRYLPAYNLVVGDVVALVTYAASNLGYVAVPFSVPTRTQPTGASVTNPTNFTCFGNTNFSPSAITFNAASVNSGQLNLALSGVTFGQSALLRATGTAQILFTGCEL
jgi:hypothetical protein